MPTSIAGKRKSNEAGFTYIMILVAVVILGILVEVTTISTSRLQQSENEAELFFRGLAYRDAIKSYYAANGTLPRSLEDLVKDPKTAYKRHLRALYPDPMSTDKEGGWQLVRVAEGGISGVASKSLKEPLKKANFPKGVERFGSAKSYSEWVFEYMPTKPPSQPLPRPSS
jgi:type II secretory pathway pseudopilin PulG